MRYINLLLTLTFDIDNVHKCPKKVATVIFRTNVKKTDWF